MLAGLAMAACGVAGSAAAQVSASASVASDYRLRGVSLSDLRPAASVSLSDDLANGIYFGGSALGQDTKQEGAQALGHVEYLGYAGRLAGGAAWDVGVSHQRYSLYSAGPSRLSYSEAYVGLSKGALSTRLSYSPDYNGQHHNVAYLEVNGTVRPAPDWRVAAHLGVFRALNRWPFVTLRPRYDTRLDVVRRLGPVELDVGWAAATSGFRAEPKRARGGLVVGLTAYF
ncbi:MAG: TorF family putative porin [Phenylobacterium sp.]